MKRNHEANLYTSFSRRLPFRVADVLLDMETKHFSSFIVGWGHKPTAEKARRYAAKHNLPYIALEDGFLRSLDLGCNGGQPLSLVVDRTGIYYDAEESSDLENILNSSGWETPELLNSARRALRYIIRHNLSKYNHAPNAPKGLWSGTSTRVLVLDQTEGDASIALGGAHQGSFLNMLNAALTTYPPQSILVKTHPDVICGKKRGHLVGYAFSRGVQVIMEDYAPLSLIAEANVIYTVTSQMGFEALMLDKKVHCFGTPFYSGWGVTSDMQACPRRKKRRSVEEIFAAAYLLYTRYMNPIKGKRCDIHDAIALLAEQRRQNERNRGFHACVGFSWWKRAYARAYLKSTGGEIDFFQDTDCAIRAAQSNDGEVVAWSSRVGVALQKSCDAAGVRLARMEDGFIRSVGLGSNFNWPYSLVVDRKGIYYDPSRACDLEDILNALPKHPERTALLAEAARLREVVLQHGLTKYNTGSCAMRLPKFPEGKVIALVPGQVEDDASVRCGGFGMRNIELLQATREVRPDAFIVYKPHPDVENGNRPGKVPDTRALRYADLILHNFPMGNLLPLIDEVHTITSQTGFEALLRGIKVFTYGGPFYAGWGLTEDRCVLSRRKAHLSLDEMVAGVLLLYPSYYDWQTKSFCRAEDVCHRLCQPDGQLRGRVWAKFIASVRGFLRKVGR